MKTETEEILLWLDELRSQGGYTVRELPLSEVQGWRYDEKKTKFTHENGRFFSIIGIDVQTNFGSIHHWKQPIISQPEIGIIGFLVRRKKESWEFLAQGKMEPGNTNLVQISPTLQATHSNYTRAHGGNTPHYLEWFLGKVPGKILFDTEQPETATRFLKKMNRNMIIEVKGQIPVHRNFKWIGIDTLNELMTIDHSINMDARSILSGWFATDKEVDLDEGCNRWIDKMRRKFFLKRSQISLSDLDQWEIGSLEIRHREQNFFSVSGLFTEASEREVTSWAQPILKHIGCGLAALIKKNDRYLVQVKVEAGNIGSIALAPTISIFDYENRPYAPFFKEIQSAKSSDFVVDTIQSEEGGRFWNLFNRYVIVETVNEINAPDHFRWCSLEEIKSLIRNERGVNSELRTLVFLAGIRS